GRAGGVPRGPGRGSPGRQPAVRRVRPGRLDTEHAGGYVNPNARIGLDPSGRYRGVFVRTVEEGGTEGGIPEGEMLCSIPWELLITQKNYGKYEYWSCDAIHELYEQFKLGSESRYAPYVNYLLHQPTGRLVDEWSDAGKAFLNEMLGHDGVEPNDGLPPQSRQMSFEDVYLGECRGEGHAAGAPGVPPVHEQRRGQPHGALLRHAQPLERSGGDKHDPHQARQDRRAVRHEGHEGHTAGTADRDKLQQVQSMLARCEGWKFRMNVGTDDRPEWDLLYMCLRKDDEGTLEVTFGDNYTPPKSRRDEMPLADNVRWLSYHVDRLVRLGERMEKDAELRSSMPSYEWETIGTYRRAVLTAMSAAILASDVVDYWDYDEDEKWMDDENWEGERMEKRKGGPPHRIREEGEMESSGDYDDSNDDSDDSNDDSNDDAGEDDGEASEPTVCNHKEKRGTRSSLAVQNIPERDTTTKTHMTQELMANVRLGGAERPARVADVVSAEEGPVRKPVEKFPRADESSQGGSKSVRADR
ncbi:hypothetical protein THAOC_02661, partial [Thalassiosira oceanica]